MCSNIFYGVLDVMSFRNGEAHFFREVSRWTYPSGRTIVASPETDGFRLYPRDRVGELRLWSYKVFCENLLSLACSSPRICWTEIWKRQRFYSRERFVILSPLFFFTPSFIGLYLLNFISTFISIKIFYITQLINNII